MDPLLLEETVWLQVLFFALLFGIVSLVWGIKTGRKKLIRWSVLAFMVAALVDIPLYYTGMDILGQLREGSPPGLSADEYQMELYTTLLLAFSLGLASLTVYALQKSMENVPRFILVALAGYAILVATYFGWRIW